MIRVAVIIGSTRPNRIGEGVARWTFELLKQRADAQFELVDLKDFNLPLLDEPNVPSMGHYTQPHTLKWAAKIASFDAFVFVTPEYNHSTSAALKNALDFLYKEWNNKACSFVSYGGSGGTRAVEQLRLTVAELQIASVRAQVTFSTRLDFENHTVFKPQDYHVKEVQKMADQVIAWGNALQPLRNQSS